MTSERNNTAPAMMLSNIVAPVFERPRVGLTLMKIVRDCIESIRNHENLTNVQCPESETVLLWDALRFARRRWQTIDLPDNVLNDRRIRRHCTGIFSVLSYDRRLENYNAYQEQVRVLPNVGERVRVSDNGMRVCFGTQARLRSSTATVVRLDSNGVCVEFAALEGGRGRRRRAVVNYNEDSDDEEDETKPKLESKPQVKAENTSRNLQFTLPRIDINRNGELPPQREPERPSIDDVSRVLRLVSYILYTISIDNLMSGRCEDIADQEVPEWVEEAGLVDSDEHYEKWNIIMQNCEEFEVQVVHDINITTICGNITDLCNAWDDIDDLSFDY